MRERKRISGSACARVCVGGCMWVRVGITAGGRIGFVMPMTAPRTGLVAWCLGLGVRACVSELPPPPAVTHPMTHPMAHPSHAIRAEAVATNKFPVRSPRVLQDAVKQP